MTAALFLAAPWACSQDAEWVAPPASTLGSAIIARTDGSFLDVAAYDLRDGTVLRFEDLGPEARIEAALFQETLDQLELLPGPLMASDLSNPLRPRDALEYRRLALEADAPEWVSSSELSSAFEAFPLPSVRPPDDCPEFESRLAAADTDGAVFFGTRGPNNALVLAGQAISVKPNGEPEFGEARLRLLNPDDTFTDVEVVPPTVLYAGLAIDGRGYWSDPQGQTFRGDIVSNRLELTPMGQSLETAVRTFAGSVTSSVGLYAVTGGAAGQGIPPRLHQFDGEAWTVLEELPNGEKHTIAFGEDELVLVSDVLPAALHIKNGEIRRLPLPDIAVVVQYVPGLGFIAGERASYMQYVPGEGGWRSISPPPAIGLRLRGLAAYQDGFISVSNASIAFWSPSLKGFCPIFEFAWAGLTFAEAIGDELYVIPQTDPDAISMRAYVLRDTRPR